MKLYEGVTTIAYDTWSEVSPVPPAISFYETRQWIDYCARTSTAPTIHLAPREGFPGVTTGWISESQVDGLISCATRPSGRTLVLAPPKCYESPVHGLVTAGDTEIAAFVEDVRALAVTMGANAALIPFAGPDVARTVAARLGAERVLLTGGRSVLPVPSSFEDYLAVMSRDRRAAVRREIRRFAAAGLTTRRLGLAEFPDVCAPLIAQTQEKYGLPVGVDVLIDQLTIMREVAGEALVALVSSTADGTPVGTSVLFQHGETLTARMVGFDYPGLTGAFEYFELLVYAPLRHCLRAGLNNLDLGFGAYEGKVGRGGGLVPAFAVDLSPEPLWSPAARATAWQARAKELSSYHPLELVW